MSIITGTSGNDTLNGTSGADIIYAQGGNDVVNGGDGNDEIGGGSGNDQLNGGGGNDTIFGGLGADTVDGGSGSDLIFGSDNNDRIAGGSGNDNILGSAGDDIMNGGTGADTFTFFNNHGEDFISDFSPSEGDRIELGGSISSFTLFASGFFSDGNDGIPFTSDDLYTSVTMTTGQGSVDIFTGPYPLFSLSLQTSVISNAVDII